MSVGLKQRLHLRELSGCPCPCHGSETAAVDPPPSCFSGQSPSQWWHRPSLDFLLQSDRVHIRTRMFPAAQGGERGGFESCSCMGVGGVWMWKPGPGSLHPSPARSADAASRSPVLPPLPRFPGMHRVLDFHSPGQSVGEKPGACSHRALRFLPRNHRATRPPFRLQETEAGEAEVAGGRVLRSCRATFVYLPRRAPGGLRGQGTHCVAGRSGIWCRGPGRKREPTDCSWLPHSRGNAGKPKPWPSPLLVRRGPSGTMKSETWRMGRAAGTGRRKQPHPSIPGALPTVTVTATDASRHDHVSPGD